jgi:ABC-type polysaccharide/polyol phosphate export permease
MAASSLTSNSGLLKAFQLHPVIMVLSSFMDNLFNFVVATLIISGPVIMLSEIGPQWSILLAPVALLPLVIGTFALASFVSLLNVFYRDTSFVLSFFFSIFFFLTPVFYPVDMVPSEYRWLIDINPFHHFITPYRLTLYQSFSSDWVYPWLKAMLWATVIGVFSWNYWRRKRNALFISI